PWLVVRGGRDDPRDAGRTASQHPKRPALSRGLSYPRVRRHRLLLHGSARTPAAFSGVRQLPAARLSSHARPEIFLSLQLAANHGERHGSRPYGVSPHDRQRLPVHRRVWRAAGAGVHRDAGVGMMYIGTRRVAPNIWVRMVEVILPNLQQVAPIWEDGHREHSFSGPMMSRWIVPLDDTNTMFIEFRHVSETDGVTPAWWADRANMLPGQLAAASYEAGQRQPGDYEAQVSQRPIAIHGLE